ncbi:substrate-binding periplasmic protein [Vibrio bivalvicida]|uniref:Solute-binding protein family 3/N-terminal domain-containing protein n=1 Tax=Vibrio bivalvicida TaxID=1276888 RepID=A0A177Y074_9VIBR|nr:transporter substrate-binding domain-containing protein [Vibrio bivalvicida]OAJ94026.1 hypothetical protein APB76_12510 [Vibrio bivalvicida]
MNSVFCLSRILSSALLVFPFSINALEFSSFPFPPFVQQTDKNIISGPFKDMVSDICKEMKEQCTFKLVPNKRSKLMVLNGDVDAGFPYGWNKERSNTFYFSIPFMVSEYGFFVPLSKAGKILKLADIQGFRVGVFGPSNTSKSLEEIQKTMLAQGLKPITIDMKTDATGNLTRMLATGRIDAYYSNKSVALYRAKEYNVSNIHYAFSNKQVTYFVAFPKETTDVDLVKKFNGAALNVFSRENYLEDKLAPWGISLPHLNQEILDQYNIIK